MQNVMWIVTAGSLAGTILNIKKKKVCFWIWLFTNSSWCVYDFWISNYPQAILFLVYTGLAVYGIYEWNKNK
jgi:nicotinamide mononucleotide transporter